MQHFREFVQEEALLDLGFVGHPFTLCNRRNGDSCIKMRLDRAMCDAQLCSHFPLVMVTHLPMSGADHCPLLLDNMLELERELSEAWEKEELYWQARARDQHLKARDKNTKYFHALTIMRRSQNLIMGLEDGDGTWVENGGRIKEVVLHYFENIFRANEVCQPDNVLGVVSGRVTSEMNQQLTKRISCELVKKVVFEMPPDKSPGPDGMTVCFFQKIWDIVSFDISNVVDSFFFSCDFLRKVNNTHICLVPKATYPRNMTRFSLSAYSAFLPGRIISDNILIAHEMLHFMKTNKSGKESSMAIKLDMSQAYDRVE
ncbi:hypothetical protein LIER_29387 [Lithospermum erythrorhizon]|uniref:Reverse transcriptase n=1 Tax=Lithospermum erythrorhizon TaxID=34254 RepID=A0AAV3RMK6_LITER